MPFAFVQSAIVDAGVARGLKMAPNKRGAKQQNGDGERGMFWGEGLWSHAASALGSCRRAIQVVAIGASGRPCRRCHFGTRPPQVAAAAAASGPPGERTARHRPPDRLIPRLQMPRETMPAAQ
jgi:hypothetical protein